MIKLDSTNYSIWKSKERRGRSHQRNSHRYDDHRKLRGRSRTRKDIKCFHCNKTRHAMKEYKCLKQDKSRGKGKDDKREDNDKDIIIVVSDSEVNIVYDDNYINLVCHDYE
uniref:Retrovirus-related Pol polyprotein from transposon TNT 1-94 n=1 Tax=Cajanus cajan TaxID=3821 RepID=A0A151S6I9_CAJCA|nr:hypothetical protein KK1_027764 [Cajanus cajan]